MGDGRWAATRQYGCICGDDIFAFLGFLLSDRLWPDFLQGVHGAGKTHLDQHQVLDAGQRSQSSRKHFESAATIMTVVGKAPGKRTQGVIWIEAGVPHFIHVSRHATSCTYFTASVLLVADRLTER